MTSLLVRRFLDSVPAAIREGLENLPALETHLDELFGAVARAQGLTAEQLFPYVGSRLSDLPALEALRSIRAADLALACACVLGERSAIDTFERTCMAPAATALARMNIPHALAEEVLQELLQRLLTKKADGCLGIEGYSGRGDLRAWVKMSAVRASLRVVQPYRREAHGEDELLLGLPGSDKNPALARLREQFRDAFRAAFKEALEALSDGEKLLLRQHYLDGLTLDELGPLHRCHRATVARKLANAREQLLRTTKKILRKKFGISADECDSLLRLARSQLDVSLAVQLAERDTSSSI